MNLPPTDVGRLCPDCKTPPEGKFFRCDYCRGQHRQRQTRYNHAARRPRSDRRALACPAHR